MGKQTQNQAMFLRNEFNKLRQFHDNEFHGDFKIEQVVYFMVSVNKGQYGIVISVSKNVYRFYQFKTSEVLSQSLYKFMLFNIALKHGQMVDRFLSSHSSKPVCHDFLNWALKKNGYVLPVYVVAKPMQLVHQKGLRFITFMYPDRQYDDVPIAIVDNDNLNLLAINETFNKYFGLSPYFAYGYNVGSSFKIIHQLLPKMSVKYLTDKEQQNQSLICQFRFNFVGNFFKYTDFDFNKVSEDLQAQYFHYAQSLE